MNDNLPEINFKEKKEKKGGALGWLRSRLGFGSRGAMGEAGINPAAINVGRTLGAARFGSSSAGIAGLLAGKAGLLITAAIVAVAGGMYVARNTPAPSNTAGSFSSNKTPDNYVPAILRSQAANQGSSLDMFKDTNKGALSMDANASKAAAEAAAADKAAADKAAAQADSGQPAPGQGNMAQEMLGKLQGGGAGSLTSSLGGSGNNFSAMGGFGNKFNQGATGAKTGFSSGIGAGFSALPKFDQRKGKMLAMKGASRPVFSNAKAGKGSKFGTSSYSQAKGLRATQKTYSGDGNIDAARSTQDKAWEGSTAAGETTGGAGVGDGGAGVVTSPSLDNAGSGGGGGGGGTPTAGDPTIPDVPNPATDSPWAGTLNTMMMLLMASAVLAAIGSVLVNIKIPPWVAVIGYMLCLVAALLAAAVMVMAAMLMKSQFLMGMVYLIGGGVAAAGALAAMGGIKLSFSPLWLCGAAAAMALIAGMMGGK